MKKTPASLRSDPRPLCPGLPGRFALDWVADLTGIRKCDRRSVIDRRFGKPDVIVWVAPDSKPTVPCFRNSENVEVHLGGETERQKQSVRIPVLNELVKKECDGE